jgi:hypothetical protein
LDAWWAVSHEIAGLLTAVAAGLWLWKWRSVGRHFFFLFFFSLTVAYLDVFPVLALHEDAGQVLEGLGVGAPADIVREYAIMQLYCFGFFQVPLVLGYFAGQRRGQRPTGEPLVSNASSSRIIAIGSIGFSLLFLWVLFGEGLLMAHVSVDLTPVLVEMPFFKFFVYRLFQESGVFLIGILFFLAQFSGGGRRRLAWVAWATAAGAYVTWAIFNSRWSVLLLVVCSLGFWLASLGDKIPSIRVFARVVAGVLLGAYLAMIVVNVRRMGLDGRLSWGYFVPQGTGAFGDEQGYMRLNGIDLMARMLPGVEREGPALGAAWRSAGWYVRRFTDPQGFDEFRLSRNTTAKSYLMEKYLGWNLSDYYSCTLTDLFGNFYILGLLGGAALLVMLLRFSASRLAAPRNGTALVLAVFVVVQAVVFDREAVELVFGWTKQLPILLMVLALRPFRVELVRQTSGGATASRAKVPMALASQHGGPG